METSYPSQDMAAYMRHRRRTRRIKLLAMLGGGCVDCGATENLDFNHIEPAEKSFEIASGLYKNWDLLVAEAEKCDLRCKLHHLEETRRQRAAGKIRTRKGLLAA